MTALPPPPVGFASRPQQEEFRQLLLGVGFEAKTISQFTSRYTIDRANPNLVDALLASTDSPEPLPILLRTFILGGSVDIDRWRNALDVIAFDQWVKAGYVEERDGKVWGRVALWPFAGYVVASDRDPSSTDDPSVVMGMSPSTESLARTAIRADRVEAALDLGTGTGLLAMILAKTSRTVIATDIEERALEFARHNATLNGLSNIEFRRGDGLEPVAGQSFDRVLCNPPYVLAPQMRQRFRDGSATWQRELLRSLPSVLNPGGTAQLLSHWPLAPDESPETVLAPIEDAPVDAEAWVGRINTAPSYAAIWAPGGEGSAPGDWLRSYVDDGVERVAEGLISIRRTLEEGEVAQSITWAPPRLDQDAPRDLERRLKRGEAVRRTAGAILEEKILRVCPGVRIIQETEAREDGWAAPRMRVAHLATVIEERVIDATILALLTRFDGKTELARVITALESERSPAAEGSSSPEWREIARDLLEDGYVEIVKAS